MRVSPSPAATSSTGWAPISSGGNWVSRCLSSGLVSTFGAGFTVTGTEMWALRAVLSPSGTTSWTSKTTAAGPA